MSEEEAASWTESLLTQQSKQYARDGQMAQFVRGSILGLPENVQPTWPDINNSLIFRLRRVGEVKGASKTLKKQTEAKKIINLPPEASMDADISGHWIPILWTLGLLHTESYDHTKSTGSTPTLYTWEDLTNLHPNMSIAWAEGTVLPELVTVLSTYMQIMPFDYVVSFLHNIGSINRATHNDTPLPTKKKQIVYCPYGRVMSENNPSAVLHVRRHLRLEFLCGGCLNFHSPFPVSTKGGGKNSMQVHVAICRALEKIRNARNLEFETLR